MVVKIPTPDALPTHAWMEHTSGRLLMEQLGRRLRPSGSSECIRVVGYNDPPLLNDFSPWCLLSRCIYLNYHIV